MVHLNPFSCALAQVGACFSGSVATESMPVNPQNVGALLGQVHAVKVQIDQIESALSVCRANVGQHLIDLANANIATKESTENINDDVNDYYRHSVHAAQQSYDKAVKVCQPIIDLNCALNEKKEKLACRKQEIGKTPRGKFILEQLTI